MPPLRPTPPTSATPSRRPATVALLLVVALGVVGCASGGSSVDSPFNTAPAEGTIRIEVNNRNFNDATLHAFRGAERIRLGMITGKTEESFPLEWSASRALQVEIDLVGQRSCVTPELVADPGDVIYLEIGPDFRRGRDCLLRR